MPSDHARAPERYRQDLQAGFRRILDGLVAAERPDVVLVGNTSMGEHLPELAGPHGLPSVLMSHGITTAAMLGADAAGELSTSVCSRASATPIAWWPSRHTSPSRSDRSDSTTCR